MSSIIVSRRTIRREWTIFGVMLMISVGLMGVSGTRTAKDLESSVNTALTPIETVINSAADTAGSYFSALTQIDHLRTDNDRLKQENKILQDALNRAPGISRINDDWTKITQEAGSVPYQTTTARVIVRDISGSSRTLVINKGTNDGLTEGQVVIDAGYAVVGRIVNLDATASVVLLINDVTAVVVGKEAVTGATGTIKGQVNGELLMSYVDSTTTLKKGDSVVTAGESLPDPRTANSSPYPLPGILGRSPYPPGLLIGTILDVSTDPNAVVQSADLQPAARLADATFVLIITDYQGGFGPALPSASPGASGSLPITPSTRPKATPKPVPTY